MWQLLLVWTHLCTEKKSLFFLSQLSHKGKLAQWSFDAFISLQFFAWSKLKYSAGLCTHPEKLCKNMSKQSISSMHKPMFCVWTPDADRTWNIRLSISSNFALLLFPAHLGFTSSLWAFWVILSLSFSRSLSPSFINIYTANLFTWQLEG